MKKKYKRRFYIFFILAMTYLFATISLVFTTLALYLESR